MLPLMQKPSFRLLTWKADTGGWWETCWRGGRSSNGPSSGQPWPPPFPPGPSSGREGSLVLGLGPGAACHPRVPPRGPQESGTLWALPKDTRLSQPWWGLHPERIPPAAATPGLFGWSQVGPPRNRPGLRHCPPAARARPPQSPCPAQGGPCLLGDVEGVAVGLGVEPAAAEGLPQDGVVGLLDALQATNKRLA